MMKNGIKNTSKRKMNRTSVVSKSTERFVKVCEEIIQDPVMRKQTISFIKAVDGKKIRNTSGV